MKGFEVPELSADMILLLVVFLVFVIIALKLLDAI